MHGLLASETDTCNPKTLMMVQDFSNLDQLFQVLTYVMKLRQKIGSTTFSGNKRNFAELFLIRSVQASVKNHKNFPMWKIELMFFEDDNGILRCRGRIDNAANLPYLTKHPILLPSNHPLTTLYIH